VFSSNDLVQFLGMLLLFGENDNLVELKIIKKLNKLSNLLVIVKLHVVLL
jgi:hypothetical protein